MSSEIFKNSPTLFPFGFSVNKACEGEIIMIEFSDKINGTQTVVGSYALPKSVIKTLSDALIEALDENTE